MYSRMHHHRLTFRYSCYNNQNSFLRLIRMTSQKNSYPTWYTEFVTFTPSLASSILLSRRELTVHFCIPIYTTKDSRQSTFINFFLLSRINTGCPDSDHRFDQDIGVLLLLLERSTCNSHTNIHTTARVHWWPVNSVQNSIQSSIQTSINYGTITQL